MPRSKRVQRVDRINLATSTATRAAIESLQKRTGAATMEEVVRRSILYYDQLVCAEEEDRKVYLEDDRGFMQRLVIVP